MTPTSFSRNEIESALIARLRRNRLFVSAVEEPQDRDRERVRSEFARRSRIESR